MQTMKACRLHAIGDFRTDEVSVPIPKGKELLVKIGACGVCGSDLPRVYEHGTSSGIYPLTLGHEFAGTIVEVGPEADPSLVGKRGAFFPLIPCMRCDPCLSGHYAMCEHYDYMGSRRDGGMADYCLVPSEWHLVASKNPETPMEALAMTEPACVAQHAIRKAEMFAGANVVVFGAGPIGIMAGRWAKLAGAGHVLMVDVVDSKVEFARERGFDAVNSRTAFDAELVRSFFDGRLADICIEGTGYGSALENAIIATKPLGRIVLMGNPAGDTTFRYVYHSQILRKELTLCGMWNHHFNNTPINEWRYCVDMMDAGKFECVDLISHRANFDALPHLIEDIHERRVYPCKAMSYPEI